MSKHIYLIRGSEKQSYQEFKKHIVTAVSSLANKEYKVKFTITEEIPPMLSIIPLRKSKIAVVSIYGDLDRLEELSPESIKGFAGSYLVNEALPVSYEKNWDDGQVTPGICLLTLFRKKKELDYNTFIDRWHQGHTPLSMKIHPLWHYNRNVIKDILSNESEIFNGIVEEHFRTRSDLLNPFRFFGNPFIVIPRMWQVYTDVRSFIDYPSIESYLVSEYIIRS